MSLEHYTLLCTTAYFDRGDDNRISQWVEYYRRSKIERDIIVILDDGSKNIPSDYLSSTMDNLGICPTEGKDAVVVTFPDHLGRIDGAKFPGWARSFFGIARVCSHFGAVKAVFIESDACVISDRLIEWINNVDDGWYSMWCPRHGFPETSIQVIAGTGIVRLDRQNTAQEARYDRNGREWEHELGIGTVVKDFVGDRYLESSGPIPAEADYSCQHVWGMERVLA